MSDNVGGLIGQSPDALSEWHQGNLVHWRIHLTILNLKNAKYSHDLRLWFNGLNDLFSELSGSMKPDELEKGLTGLKVIHSYLLNNIPFEEASWFYLDLEIFLRGVMRDRGLDLPRKKDPKRSLLE